MQPHFGDEAARLLCRSRGGWPKWWPSQISDMHPCSYKKNEKFTFGRTKLLTSGGHRECITK